MIEDRKSLQNDARPRVSVIIVTYKSAREIPDCIESLLKQHVPVEMFLVDNASQDDTPQMGADYAARFENIHAILNAENIGLAAGNNTPLGKCQGDYVLMLNPDTVLRENSLERMVDFLDRNPDAGVVGPKNLYADGTPLVSAHRHWGLLHVLLWRGLAFLFFPGLVDPLSPHKRQGSLFVFWGFRVVCPSIFFEISGVGSLIFFFIQRVLWP